MNSVIEALALRRTYPHPRDLVFRAWTEPSRIEKWFSPNPKNKVEAEVDLRVGGKYRIAMIPPEGDSWVVVGEYRDVARPERLAFTWKWTSGDEESLVTLEFLEVPNGTEISLTHSNLETEDSYNGHKDGWIACLDRLTQYLEEPMSALTEISTDLVSAAAQIRQAKQVTEMALSRLKDTYAHVPDDKLFWSPYETSKSPTMIVGHTAYCNEYFAAVLRGDDIPPETPGQVVSKADAEASKIKTRAEANEVLERTSQVVLASFDQLDPARLTTDPRTGFILTLIPRHIDGHAGQIDYLQTTWGDMEDHFGM